LAEPLFTFSVAWANRENGGNQKLIWVAERTGSCTGTLFKRHLSGAWRKRQVRPVDGCEGAGVQRLLSRHRVDDGEPDGRQARIRRLRLNANGCATNLESRNTLNSEAPSTALGATTTLACK